MGNQSSKGKEGFESYPSFTRSDTQGSSRSFSSFRKKIKGGNNNGDQSETNSIHGSLPGEKAERYFSN
jgi:serine/threonine-protein phosphatase PP1 catalytic subunit